MDQAATLQYPPVQLSVTPVQGEHLGGETTGGGRAEAEQDYGAMDVIPTSTWVNLYGSARGSDGAPLAVGSVVKVVDPEGVTCGAARVTTEGQYGLLPCYGDDSTTPADEGAQPGDPIQVMVDGQVLGEGTWTAHGERQWRPLGKVDRWNVYLPVVQRGNR
jgi:hypothetical protein